MSDVVEVEGLSAVIGEILDEYSEKLKRRRQRHRRRRPRIP